MMQRYVFGGALIALGVMCFLQVTGQFDFGLSFWPVLLTLAGGIMVWSSFPKKRAPSWVGLGLGLWVGCIGLFSILHEAGAVAVTGATVARLGWPLLLVGIGVSIFMGRSHCCDWGRWRECGHRHGIGDRHHARERWVLDGDLDLSHGIGDFVLDLTTAEIAEGVHRIRVGMAIGEMVIRVPDNVDVTVDASVNVGELEVFGEERSGIGGLSIQKRVQAPEAPVKLVIDARLRMGELSVIQVPGYPGVAS